MVRSQPTNSEGPSSRLRPLRSSLARIPASKGLIFILFTFLVAAQIGVNLIIRRLNQKHIQFLQSAVSGQILIKDIDQIIEDRAGRDPLGRTTRTSLTTEWLIVYEGSLETKKISGQFVVGRRPTFVEGQIVPALIQKDWPHEVKIKGVNDDPPDSFFLHMAGFFFSLLFVSPFIILMAIVPKIGKLVQTSSNKQDFSADNPDRDVDPWAS